MLPSSPLGRVKSRREPFSSIPVIPHGGVPGTAGRGHEVVGKQGRVPLPERSRSQPYGARLLRSLIDSLPPPILPAFVFAAALAQDRRSLPGPGPVRRPPLAPSCGISRVSRQSFPCLCSAPPVEATCARQLASPHPLVLTEANGLSRRIAPGPVLPRYHRAARAMEQSVRRELRSNRTTVRLDRCTHPARGQCSRSLRWQPRSSTAAR